MAQNAKSVIARLRNFSTCDVSDALYKLDVANAGFLPDIQQRTLPKPHCHFPLIGRAWTVRFVEKTSPQKPDFSGHYVDQIPSNISTSKSEQEHGALPVIPVLGAPAHFTNAVFGGIMGLRASLQGVPAVVVSGRIRDLVEMNSSKSTAAIFSRGLSIVGAGVTSKVVSMGTSCEVTDYGTVHTGDLIMIDENGIVVVSKSIELALLLETIERSVEQDERVKESVLAGMTVQEAFKKWRT